MLPGRRALCRLLPPGFVAVVKKISGQKEGMPDLRESVSLFAMSAGAKKVISVVPEGQNHRVKGDRKVILPGVALEILSTRMIELTEWKLCGLNDPFWRLYIPIKGRAEVQYDADADSAGTIKLQPGKAYMIPPHTTLYSRIEKEPFHKWYVHFTLGQRGDRAVPGVYRVESTAKMQEVIESFSGRKPPLYPWESLTLVGEALSQLPNSIWSKRNVDARVEQAMEYMYGNMSRKLAAAEIATASAVSVRTLNHLFQQDLGMSPMHVLLEFRINHACRLLRHTDLTIDQIAEDCGFPNRYYLSRMMKQVRSISPAAYRNGGLGPAVAS